MPEWTSKKQVEVALKKARQNLVKVRRKYDVDTPEYRAAIAECVKLDNILRRM